MRKVMKATGYGLKHFFGARDSRKDFKTMGRQFSQAGTKLRKAEVMAAMGMYAVYKGSPIGLAKNIHDSIKQGRWKYGDMQNHQANLDEVLDGTRMSEQGKRAVAELVRRGGSEDEAANLSPADLAEFAQFRTDMYIAAGHHINVTPNDF